jgi:hypothetical protein
MQKHISENLGTETKRDVLDLHHGCKTYSHICCHCVVAKGQFKNKQDRTGQIAKDDLLGY